MAVQTLLERFTLITVGRRRPTSARGGAPSGRRWTAVPLPEPAATCRPVLDEAGGVAGTPRSMPVASLQVTDTSGPWPPARVRARSDPASRGQVSGLPQKGSAGMRRCARSGLRQARRPVSVVRGGPRSRGAGSASAQHGRPRSRAARPGAAAACQGLGSRWRIVRLLSLGASAAVTGPAVEIVVSLTS